MQAAISVEQLYQLASAKEKKHAKRQARIDGISEADVLMELLLDPMRVTGKRREKKLPHRIPEGAWRGWFDGSQDPYTGVCMIGAYLESPEGRQISVSRLCGCGTSAVAEYEALLALMETAIDADVQRLVVYGDAKGVIDQITGESRTFNRYLRVLRQRVLRMAKQFEVVEFEWIPRRHNRIADQLAADARAHLDAGMLRAA